MKDLAAKWPATSAEYLADFACAYNEEIDRLLLRLAKQSTQEKPRALVDSLFAQLSEEPENFELLGRWSPEETNDLKAGQADHLRWLLAAGITPTEHFEKALRLRLLHEMVGIPLELLLKANHFHRRQVDAMLTGATFSQKQRGQLRLALYQRLQLDLDAQITSHARSDQENVALLASLDEAIQRASNLSDILRFTLDVLGAFDGILACLFSRPDARGVMQIEAEGGSEGSAYAQALRSQRVPLFETQSAGEAGQGPAGEAWRSGQIRINNSFQVEGALHPWRDEALRRGFRSSAAVPLLDESGQAFAILNLYSGWPGFFSSPPRATILRHIQLAMSHAILHCGQTSVISADMGRAYRQYLEDGAVEMLYQPVIDLRTGKLESVEALARLRTPDGKLISPADFLPAFGNAGLLRLFQVGLDQVCKDLRAWREQAGDFDLSVSLNLPADGLTHDSYRDCVFETLTRWELAPTILTLEMLETKESLDVGRRDARIAEFQGAGIRIAQDDLGSGHSSLLRMDRVPADRVKIDQGLVRGALKRPVRALEFIHHLTLLSQGFGAPVTVEGLEDVGLIEAAAILGADHGQGYGIARPMSAQSLLSWKNAWQMPIDPAHPRTALGALAGYLLWDYKLGNLTDWPELLANFIKEPWLVHEYLEHLGHADPDLSMMLERTQILALHGHRSPKYKQMRQELIERLGEIWLNERN
ncbi:MAG TPA: EAL domain-containing protein [Terracidiphilus sp.]|jgi:EAL domain-containing protein (putative c-di-GMP-specific phosphodiesterase class I)|nr:EAL domain-containing protein [Terracidiphilus sp.]